MDELSQHLQKLTILRSNFDQNQELYKNQSMGYQQAQQQGSPQHQGKKVGPSEYPSDVARPQISKILTIFPPQLFRRSLKRR